MMCIVTITVCIMNGILYRLFSILLKLFCVLYVVIFISQAIHSSLNYLEKIVDNEHMARARYMTNHLNNDSLYVSYSCFNTINTYRDKINFKDFQKCLRTY